VGGFATGWRDIKQLPSGQAKQNQAPCDLKICHRDSQSRKNNFSEKYEPNRDAEGREDSDETLSLPLFARSVPSETHKHGHQANSIYRDKNRNKGDEKFMDHVLGVLPERRFSPQMNTGETEIHQNSFCD
jgi:hypothetical protein